MDESDYRAASASAVDACLKEYQCQPVFFVGSGFSRRFVAAPSWSELLSELIDDCPLIKHDFSYFNQKFDGDLPAIGGILIEPYFEWAWGEGRGQFSPELFESDVGKDAYLKHAAARIFSKIHVGERLLELGRDLKRELFLFKKLKPHAVITTNYDTLLEEVLDQYEVYVGQKILRLSNEYIGEILKIHGSCSDPESIILTDKDYEFFEARQKYVSAKLTAYFLEHPLFFFGYSANDKNIKKILSDIAEIIDSKDELIPNIFLVRWIRDAASHKFGQSEELIDVGRKNRIRVCLIETSDFEWIFRVLEENRPINNVSPKLLRALMARSYQLVRSDVPRTPVALDFEMLERAVDNAEELPRLLGLAGINDAAALNASHPYILSQVAQELGWKTWHPAKKVLDSIRDQTEIDVQASDNPYHIKVPAGRSFTRKYSNRCLALIRKVRDGEDWLQEFTDTMAASR
jgi:hypothetical protein